MGVPISSYYRTLRAILGDGDPDIHLYEDNALQDMVIAMVNLGEAPGFIISEDLTEVIPAPSSSSMLGYVAADYGVAYGYAYNFAYAYQYNDWYDQGFIHLQQTLEQAMAQDPPMGECSPTGNPEVYARLIYATANAFVVTLTDFHFRTRAVTETIDAPKELVHWIQNQLYKKKNGKMGSNRPPPLPMIAFGVRALWNSASNATWGLGYGFFGYDMGAF